MLRHDTLRFMAYTVFTLSCTLLFGANSYAQNRGRLLDVTLDSPTPRRVGMLRSDFPTASLSITNWTPERLRVRTLRFTLRHYQPDNTPLPIFELVPLFNKFMVQVTNCGWGEMQRGRLRLHSFPAATHLLSIPSTEVTFDRIDRNGYLFFDIPAGAAPFSFEQGETVSWDELKPHVLQLAYSTPFKAGTLAQRASPVVLNPSEDFHEPGRLHRYTVRGTESGTVWFSGALAGENIRYFGKTLCVAPPGEDAESLNELLPTPFQGGISRLWYLMYGDYKAPSGAAPAPTAIGLTVNFGGLTSGTIDADVPVIDLRPGQGQELRLQFVMNRSAFFAVDVTPVYCLGESCPKEWPDGNAVRVPVEASRLMRCVVPRRHEYDWNDTRRVFEALRSADPSWQAEAIRILKFGNPKLDHGQTYAQSAKQGRDFLNALLSQFLADPASDEIRSGAATAAAAVDEMLNGMSNGTGDHLSTDSASVDGRLSNAASFSSWYPHSRGYANDGLRVPHRTLLDMVPIVCNVDPARGAELAVKAYGVGIFGPMEYALCVAQCRRQIVDRFANDVEAVLKRRLERADQGEGHVEYCWRAVDIVLAVMIDWKSWESLPTKTVETNALGWAAVKTADPFLTSVVHQILRAEPSSDSMIDVAPHPAPAGAPLSHEATADSLEKARRRAIDHLSRRKPDFIDMLGRMNGKEFVKDVGHVAQTALLADERANDGINANLILSCLRFMQLVRTPEGDRVAESLINYPYRSEVRDAAKQLLRRL